MLKYRIKHNKAHARSCSPFEGKGVARGPQGPSRIQSSSTRGQRRRRILPLKAKGGYTCDVRVCVYVRDLFYVRASMCIFIGIFCACTFVSHVENMSVYLKLRVSISFFRNLLYLFAFNYKYDE